MPKKYRASVDPQHKDRLDAFSFGGALDAIRRRSVHSQYSPMGSRMPSRMGSLASNKQGGANRQQSFDAAGSIEEAGDPDGDVGNGKVLQKIIPNAEARAKSGQSACRDTRRMKMLRMDGKAERASKMSGRSRWERISRRAKLLQTGTTRSPARRLLMATSMA